jgi:serine protease Do
METRQEQSKLVEYGRRTRAGATFAVLAAALAVWLAGAGMLRAQEAPEPPAAPEAPEAPAPPETPEVFVLNDGSAHLGVVLGDVSSEKAQELKLPTLAGAVVESVQKDSAAAKAGIVRGDAIVEFDGERVRSSAELRRLIRETPVGRTVAVKVVRGGKSLVLSAKLEAAKSNWNFDYNFNIPEVHIPPLNFSFGTHRATLGIDGDDLTPQLAQYFGVKQGKGVLIAEVTVGGAADKAGLKAGDVIVQVNSKSISGVEELRESLNDDFIGDTRQVTLTIVRDHHEQTINADLTRPHASGKRSTSLGGPAYEHSLREFRAEANRQRVQADELRAWAEQQRALSSEIQQKQQLLRGEWQRQMREQMLALRSQIDQMQNHHVTLRQDGEI